MTEGLGTNEDANQVGTAMARCCVINLVYAGMAKDGEEAHLGVGKIVQVVTGMMAYFVRRIGDGNGAPKQSVNATCLLGACLTLALRVVGGTDRSTSQHSVMFDQGLCLVAG